MESNFWRNSGDIISLKFIIMVKLHLLFASTRTHARDLWGRVLLYSCVPFHELYEQNWPCLSSLPVELFHKLRTISLVSLSFFMFHCFKCISFSAGQAHNSKLSVPLDIHHDLEFTTSGAAESGRHDEAEFFRVPSAERWKQEQGGSEVHHAATEQHKGGSWLQRRSGGILQSLWWVLQAPGASPGGTSRFDKW